MSPSPADWLDHFHYCCLQCVYLLRKNNLSYLKRRAFDDDEVIALPPPSRSLEPYCSVSWPSNRGAIPSCMLLYTITVMTLTLDQQTNVMSYQSWELETGIPFPLKDGQPTLPCPLWKKSTLAGTDNRSRPAPNQMEAWQLLQSHVEPWDPLAPAQGQMLSGHAPIIAYWNL